jgi:hypothetical protein
MLTKLNGFDLNDYAGVSPVKFECVVALLHELET